MGFFSGIFGGSSPELNANIKNFGSQAGFASGIGEGDVTAASKWYNDILSGDPTKTAEAIAPETSAAQQTGQQEKNQLAEFAPRSGGTASAAAGIDEGERAMLIKLIGGEQSGAAGSLATLGTNEQGLALSDQQAQDQAAQQRMKNWSQGILGHFFESGAQALEQAGNEYLSGSTSAADNYSQFS